MARKKAQETLERLYPKKPDPRYTPKTVKQAVNHIAGAKKPPKAKRATWEQKVHIHKTDHRGASSHCRWEVVA
mgnify:CR=1 FL=1